MFFFQLYYFSVNKGLRVCVLYAVKCVIYFTSKCIKTPLAPGVVAGSFLHRLQGLHPQLSYKTPGFLPDDPYSSQGALNVALYSAFVKYCTSCMTLEAYPGLTRTPHPQPPTIKC